MKKYWIVLAVLVLTALWRGTTSAASSGTCGENVTWDLCESGTTLSISGEGEIKDYPGFYSERDKITSIWIGDGIT